MHRPTLARSTAVTSFTPFLGSAEETAHALEPIGELVAPEVETAALAAGENGMLLDPLAGDLVHPKEATAPVGIPVGAPDHLFIRPGAFALTSGICTYNLIYSAGTQIGTAGHCVSTIGQNVFILATPAPTIPLVTVLGKVADFRNGGIGNDWALIDILPQWHPWVDPNMAYVGGPSCSAWGGASTVIKHAGHGIQTGVVAAVPRVGQANPSNGQSFQGISESSGGDSGSPIVTVAASPPCLLGMAAGIITHCASFTGLECIPLYWATDIRRVPATVTVGFDPI